MSEMNIYQRINEVRKQVAYVQKDSTVANKYKAVTHDAVSALLRPWMIEQGIIVVPSMLAQEVVLTGTTTKTGTPILRYEATFDVAFVNIDTPTDMLRMVVPAHANDEGDKSPGKALSYAVKAAMLKLFTLETGVDDESRVEALPAQNSELQEHADQILEYLENDDAKGLAQLVKSLPDDTRRKLTRGTRRSGGIFDFNEKQKMADLESVYDNSLKETIAAVEELLRAENRDDSAVIEALDELDGWERKLMAGWMEPADVDMIKHIRGMQ